MTSTLNQFAVLNGSPVYGDRAKINNVNTNDIISYRVNGLWVFSAVTGTSSTMIRVVDLICENTENGVNLYVNPEKNSVTKCFLRETRKIFKITNIQYL
jgi:hypothetical protein